MKVVLYEKRGEGGLGKGKRRKRLLQHLGWLLVSPFSTVVFPTSLHMPACLGLGTSLFDKNLLFYNVFCRKINVLFLLPGSGSVASILHSHLYLHALSPPLLPVLRPGDSGLKERGEEERKEKKEGRQEDRMRHYVCVPGGRSSATQQISFSNVACHYSLCLLSSLKAFSLPNGMVYLAYPI